MSQPTAFISTSWTTDVRGACTAVLEHATGLLPSLQDASFIDWIRASHPGDGAQLADTIAAAMDRREAFRHEHRVRCVDDCTRWVITTGLPRHDGDGCFAGYGGAIIDVTGQREAFERLLRSEAEHRLILDNSMDLIAHCGADSRYIHVSPSYTSVIGWRAEEMVGRSVVDFLHPDDQARARNTLGRLFGGEEIPDVREVRKRHRNGQYISLGTTVRRVTDPATGLVLGAVLVSRDITREKEMLNRIERMAEQNTALIENSPDIMLLLDLDGRVLHANKAVREILGFEPKALIGQDGLRYAGAEGQLEAGRNLAVLNQGDGQLSWNVACLCSDGRSLQLDWSMCRPAGSHLIYATARDVTERHRTRLALEQAHTQVRTILESIEDGFFSVNTRWEITYANTLAAAFVGVDRDASIGKVLWDVAAGLAESPIAQILLRAMETRENTSFEVFYEPAGVWVSERVYAHEDGLSVFFHDITERKHGEARLEHLATRDDLTGLPNRAWINQHLHALLDQASKHASTTVLFIDLNRFKEVNDSMGHAAGDRLLQQVSQRLQSCMRPGDVVARLGGDEFVVAANCAGRDAAAAIAQRLIAALKAPFQVDGLEICVGASIGISLSDGGALTPECLFQNADTAMYRAKVVGDSAYRFFEPGMSVEAKRRLQLEVAMRRALELGQFELHYQPRIDLRDMRLQGMEALLRWHHPELGRISPAEFIPIAEERGHIEAIGRWVLQQACGDARRLGDRYAVTLRVSVNVSARQLRRADLVAEVEQALRESGLPAGALELELTESALIEDTEQSADILRRLKHLGVTLSLDDFGTGYSSLSYLKRFPVDVLKLDRSFFHEQPFKAKNGDFVKALVDMAHALGLSVVAEGIETEEVMDTLRLAACDEGQGYLFARPMSLQAFDKFLQCEVQSLAFG
jgi:diguanylate cyclase (GGDEF)-like protein/PAS domain S-box-containing protein